METDLRSRLLGFISRDATFEVMQAEMAKFTAVFGPGLRVTASHEVRTPGRICDCHACDSADDKVYTKHGRWKFQRFILCPDCGNKRCPRATHHDNACTQSNDSGQEGSVYVKYDPTRPRVTLEQVAAEFGIDLDEED